MSRADLEKKPAEVQAMFDGVAERYDLTNDVLSMGQDRRWRSAVLDAVAPRPGERVLDLAAGTGTSSQPFRDAGASTAPEAGLVVTNREPTTTPKGAPASLLE